MNKKIIIDENKLEFILNSQSRAIVGQVCKRFELVSDKKLDITLNEYLLVKNNVKELLHEWTRTLKSMVLLADENSKKNSYPISKEES
jgi:hypothetical protein